MNLRLLLLTIICALSSACVVAAQPNSTETARPKIGVALSGGGARGLAHIGVLRWFDEHRIPIDYLAGTSAGAMVGAMYATGIPPVEMERSINEMQWDRVLTGIQNYENLSFRRKEDRRAFQNDLELGLQGGLRAPAGFNSGHQIGLIFDQMTLPYSDIENFDQLPVPLHIVATDIERGRAVVLKAGSLGTALRATTAIPGLFTPVERDGLVLADGALTNNLPTDVVRAMGADIVIAVDISGRLGDRSALASIPGILTQSLAILALEIERRSLQNADIIIRPNLAETVLDYSASPHIIKEGYDGTAQKSAVLQKFAVDEAEWAQLMEHRRARAREAVFMPSSIEVQGDEKAADEIRQRLNRFVGVPLEPAKLEAELDAIRGLGRYESLGYEKTRNGETTGLLIRAVPKSYGPPLINFGAQIDGSDTSNIQFAAGLRLTQFDVGGYGSELRTDARFGSHTLLATEYYRPLGQTLGHGYFIAPRAFFDVRNENLFQNNTRTAEYRTRRAGIGLDVGHTFRRSEARVGLEFGSLDAALRIGNPLLPTYSGAYSMARARYEFDGHNSASVPTKGTRFVADTRYYLDSPGATQSFPQTELSLSMFKPISDRSSVFFTGAGGTTFGDTAPTAQQFTLGGPFRVGALQSGELRGSHYLLASAGYLHQLADLPPLVGGRLYGLAFYERGGAFESFDDAEYSDSFSAALVAATRLGPVTLGGSIGNKRRSNLYFSLGRVF